MLRWSVVLAIGAGGVATAADKPRPTNPLVAGLARCRAIPADAERLACFDAAAASLVAAEQSHEVVVVTRDQVKATKRQLFGLTLDQNALFAEGGAPADRIDELHTTITAAAAGNDDRWTLVLAEGGRWRTTEAWLNADPKPGMGVDIHHGALGSYVMRAKGQAAVRVARVN